jgi:hypothetical protein
LAAHPENNKDLKFQISDSWNDKGLRDDYLIVKCKIEVDRELGSYVKSIYSNNETAFFDFGGTISIIDKYNNIPSDQLPSYQDIKQDLKKGTVIHINIHRSFDTGHPQDEYKKIYEVIQFIKTKRYAFDQILINFRNEKDGLSKSLAFQSLDGIASVEDLAKFEIKR